MKKIILVLIISILVFMPFKAKAADIDYGDCITKFGSITFVEGGSDNSNGGNVDYSKPKNNKSWSTETVTFNVELKARSGHKVQKVNYKITSLGDQSCTGSITGSLVENNKGSVKFSVVIDKGYVEKIRFSGVSVKRSDSTKKSDIPAEDLGIKKNASESEYGGADSDDEQLGDLLGVECTDKNGDGDTNDKGECVSTNNLECDQQIRDLIKKYWKWVVFLTPLLLIVMIVVDFLKAMTSGDADAIKKSTDNAIKRVIAAIVLLALPWIITVVFTWFGLENYLCF